MEFVVYLIIYKGDKLPPYYIGSTKESKLDKGYLGSVSSKKWKNIFIEEVKLNNKLFTHLILSKHSTRKEATLAEKNLQIKFDAVKSLYFFNESLASENGFFGRDVSGKLNPFYGKSHLPEDLIKISEIQKYIQNLPHNRLRNSKNQKIAQNKLEVINKKSNSMKNLYLDPEFKLKHLSGCNTDSFKSAHRTKLLGKKWIHNMDLLNQIYVIQSDLDSYLLNGWKLGMLPRNLK